jgi:hypothetical protein
MQSPRSSLIQDLLGALFWQDKRAKQFDPIRHGNDDKFLPKPKNWVAWTVVIDCYTQKIKNG